MAKPTIQNITEHQRFQGDLPFYVNGTLSPDDHAWMDSYISRYPLAQAAVDSERSLFAALQAGEDSISEEEQLARFLREMPPNLFVKPSAWQRLYGFVTQTPAYDAPQLSALWQQGVRLPAPVFAVLLVLICSQALLMGRDALDEQTQYRSQPLSSCQKMPALRVIIKPDTKYSDLVVLLRKTDTTVVAGPSESGELWLAVNGNRETRLPTTLDQLRNNPLVNEVITLPVGPCKP